MKMETRYLEVFDTRDKLRCVRLDTEEGAVVDEQSNILLRIDKCRHMEQSGFRSFSIVVMRLWLKRMDYAT